VGQTLLRRQQAQDHVIQVDSKVRARLEVPVDIAEDMPRELAFGAPDVTRALAGRAVRSL
jgi:hypothetical protein